MGKEAKKKVLDTNWLGA